MPVIHAVSAQSPPTRRIDGGLVSEHGATVRFTGLLSAGKTTITTALAARLANGDRPIEVRDGDVVRPILSAELRIDTTGRSIDDVVDELVTSVLPAREETLL